jgi:hypothetical protein
MKNTALFFFLIFLITQNSQAQSRINKSTLNFDSESGKITNVLGWELNDISGKWIKNNNVIHPRKCATWELSHKAQCFKWIQIRSLYFQEEKHYVLLYEKLSGEYEYPSIYEGWEEEMRTYFFIFTDKDFQKLKTLLSAKTGTNILFSNHLSGYITDRWETLGEGNLYNDDTLLGKIRNTLESPNYSESCFIINSQMVDDKSVVRFRLPQSCLTAESWMKSGYFEVESSKFMELLIE